jgi:hypothetical protein
MSTKFILLASVIGLATIPLLQAQSPTPAESPAAEKKHRTHKKAEAAASPAENATSPAAAESPAASPKAKRGGKTKTTAAAVPAVSPASSPAKKTLADYFKPKTSGSPAAAAAPAGTGATAGGAVAQATPARSGGHGLVWVNTETHVYHMEGSRFYGNTTHGKYVSEADAIKEGDRPAKRE